jgi:hypothetical protein
MSPREIASRRAVQPVKHSGTCVWSGGAGLRQEMADPPVRRRAIRSVMTGTPYTKKQRQQPHVHQVVGVGSS